MKVTIWIVLIMTIMDMIIDIIMDIIVVIMQRNVNLEKGLMMNSLRANITIIYIIKCD